MQSVVMLDVAYAECRGAQENRLFAKQTNIDD